MRTDDPYTLPAQPSAARRGAVVVVKIRGAVTLPTRPNRFALFGTEAVSIW